MQIVEINKGKLPGIFELIYSVYGLNEVRVHAFDDGGISGFICNDGNIGMYVDKNKHKFFRIDDNYNLVSYQGNNYLVYYGENTSYKDFNGNEYKLELVKVDEKDNIVNGKLCYTVYYPVSDILSQFTYPHIYREVEGNTRICNVDSNNYESIYIEEEFSKHKFKKGFLPKRIKAFNKVSFDYDMIGYDLVRIIENGFRYLINGDTDIEPKIEIFVKSYYVGKNGYYKDFGLLGKLYKKEEIDKLIKSYGISSGIDYELIKLYNKDDYLIHRIQSILDVIKNDKSKEDLGISLTLKEN